MSAETLEFQGGRRLVGASLILALLGAVLCLISILRDPGRFFAGYLAAWSYAVSIALGALVFLMIIHAMRASWPTLLRRLVEAMVATLPVLAALFIPLLFGLRTLYPWLRIDTIPDPGDQEIIRLREPYLNLGWFLGRTAVFFALWMVIGHLLRRWSHLFDRGPAPEARHRLYVASGTLLPLVALSLSFASIDWLMSLSPVWASTMFPVYFFAGGFLGALALLTVLTAVVDRAGLLPGVNPSHYHALGRLLLAFVIFWAYVAFFQLMLIWIANRPDEVTFYLARSRGGFRTWSVVLAVVHFAIPFFILLNYAIKRRRGFMAAAGIWLLVAHYLDVEWLVIPSLRPDGPPYALADLGALCFVGGLTVAYAVRCLRGRPLTPTHDPELPRALRYQSR